LAAAAELRSGLGTVTGATCALLVVHLLRRGGNFATHLGLVRSGLALGELPANHAVQDIGARLQTENLVRKHDGTVGLAFERGDLEIHYSAPFSSVAGAGASAGAAAVADLRTAAGLGASF